MRLYGGRIIRTKLNRRLEERRELRDAVVYSIVSAGRYCWVQIQGSSTRIKACYPENWEAAPPYLRPGNSVRISHPGGNKGRIEIVGHGFLLPTPVAGGGPPSPSNPSDAVVSGCVIAPTNPASMGAVVRPGVLRIAGINYNLSGMLMDRSDFVMDRADLVMDNVGDAVTFDAASSTHFRYDSIVAGADGDAHVVKGTNFLTTGTIPEPPAAPANHVRLGWILIFPNMTSVSAAEINRLVSDPVPAELRVLVADEELAWGETSTTITISARDQYGNLIAIGGAGYHIEIGWLRGNGTLSYGGVSQDESASLIFYTGSSAVVTYTRDGVDPGDKSPMFSINESIVGLTNVAHINLYDEAGDLMF